MKKILLIPILLTIGCLNPKQIPSRVVKNPDKFRTDIILELEHGQDLIWEFSMKLDETFEDTYGRTLVLRRDPEDPTRYIIQTVN